MKSKISAFTMNCKNCENKINSNRKYCPECGQKVNNLLSIRSLFNETINNYFSVDSRIIKSIKPLIFKPGYLALKFVEGKRLFYLHPTKFYLILSILFFFLFSSTVKKYQKIADILLEKQFNYLNTRNINNPNSKGKETYIYKKQKMDSLIAVNAPKEQILKFLEINEQDNKFKKTMYSQLLKIYIHRGEGILKAFYSTISITLLILIPIFAVFLKLFFFKNGPLSHHLVFSFYFFSFLFVIFNVILITKFIFPIPIWVYLLTLCLTTTHLLFGILRFYNKRFLVSLIKTGLLLISFFLIVLPILIVILGFITLLIF